MDKQIETGMIMDATAFSESTKEKKEAMEAVIENDQMKKLEVLAQSWKAAHTQKVREYDKVGRNEPCPCGSLDKNGKPKKYKNCCLKTGKYESIIYKK